MEIQFRILSHFALDYLFGFNKKLCKKIAYFDYKKYLEKRVESLEKILQFRDPTGGTAAKWWNNIATVIASQKDDQYKIRVTSLFDGTALRKDMEDFQKSFPHNIKQIPADNLVLKMYENTQVLLEK